MRVLVCGGRDFSDQQKLYTELDLIHKAEPIDVIIEGDARGADRIAGQWAKRNKINLLLFPAEWDKYGNRAGPIRNQQMLDEGKPDLVVAFPGGKGTSHMVRISKEQGFSVIEI